MTSNTLHTIHKKLQNQSEDILKQVLGYLDGILEIERGNNRMEHADNDQLTEEQKQALDTMENLTDKDFISREEFHQRTRERYGF